MKRIIFHVPYHVNIHHASGTNIRPLKMLKAFEDLGYHVDKIYGRAQQRKLAINEIKESINNGDKYDFLYSESSTEPTLLTEPHHLPLHPFIDFGFFKFCKKNNIPIGLYYRDIHWRFPFYSTNLPYWKAFFAKLFYRYDLIQYRKYVDVLYLPSQQMIDYLPDNLRDRIRLLPPAADTRELATKSVNIKGGLDLLYIGGLRGHYEVSEMLKAIEEGSDIRLTLCCRKDDWEKEKATYEPLLNRNIELVHRRGEELLELFAKADITMFFVKPGEYMSFAIPIKMYEYMSHLKPIIVSDQIAATDFVKENNTGWVVQYKADELKSTLKRIFNNPELLQKKVENIRKILGQHNWISRARQVSKDLIKKD